MAEGTNKPWFPLFEFAEWTYSSTLVLPTDEQSIAAPGAAVTARKWAMGKLEVGQAFVAPGSRYTLDGTLSFAPGVSLDVSASGVLGLDDEPATFEAIGVGTHGITKGARYVLVGWAFPDLPIQNNGGRVQTVLGSVRAVRGPNAAPGRELGQMPLGTVGSFVITRTQP